MSKLEYNRESCYLNNKYDASPTSRKTLKKIKTFKSNLFRYELLEKNSLKALKYVSSFNNRVIILFQCVCGKQVKLCAYKVDKGIIKSCGCDKNEKI